MTRKKIFQSLGALISLFIFAAAVFVLRRELVEYNITDILRSFSALPAFKIVMAILLTFVTYLVMTAYDFLGLRYVKQPLSYLKTAFAAFIASAMSNNLGCSMLASSSVRYRLYSSWGIPVLKIAKIVVFCMVSFALGFLVLGGVVLLFDPSMFHEVVHLPASYASPLGLVFLGLSVVYVLLSALRKRPLKILKWELALPSTRISLGQIFFALTHWVLAGTVLYTLLPAVPALSYTRFIAIFLLSHEAGLLSQVPGGLGVFESAMLLFLTPALPASTVLGILLAYRAIYYLLPLSIAATLLGGQEVLRKREQVGWIAARLGEQTLNVAPRVLAVTAFVGGAFLLFAGAVPTMEGPLIWLKDLLPLPVLGISHFGAGLAGMALLLLACGMKRRLDAVYLITVALLVCGIVYSLYSGRYFERTIILSAVFGMLLPNRRHFYWEARFFSQSLNLGWIVAVTVIFLCSVL